MASGETVRLAAIADLHCTKTSQGVFQRLFSEISASADVVAICGDLTDYGLPEEARVLAKEISSFVKIPVVAVLGNHDFESGKQDEVSQILSDVGVNMLSGDACEVRGVGFAGIRGFGGGFGRYALAPWGEETVKRFVHEALDEALKLESALTRLRMRHAAVIMHYAPIRATVEGEPVEIYPFLGSSRLEEPLLRYPVSAVFHGHAHHGTFEGRLRDNTPVYNVSLPLLRTMFPERQPYFTLELGMAGPSPDGAHPQSASATQT
jgi:Icc-related predicted phosphoesterase